METTAIKPTSVRFSADVLEYIKARSKEEHRSVSNYINSVFAKLMAQDETPSEDILQMLAKADEDYKAGRYTRCSSFEDSLKHLDSL